MVAKNDEGILSQVPELILENSLDVRRFMEAIFRKYMRTNLQANMKSIRDNFVLEEEVHKLEGERCIINLEENK